MDWFLYDNSPRHEKVKQKKLFENDLINKKCWSACENQGFALGLHKSCYCKNLIWQWELPCDNYENLNELKHSMFSL